MDIPPYPLQWPDNMPRTAPSKRRPSQFKTTLASAIKNVEGALRRFGADSASPIKDVVATTNISGVHLGGNGKIDPGVAVWFEWEGALRCIAVDRYHKPEENLQAIFHILEARRTEVRHGGIMIARTAFRGFVALPAPGSRHWSEVLGVSANATKDEITAAYREKAKTAHPDRGGSDAAMEQLNRARKEALAEL